MFIASTVAAFAIPTGAGRVPDAARLIASITLLISGSGLLVRGIKAIRDAAMGRHAWNRDMFPAGRCHACGYDTSALVHGIVACPECGVILASAPRSMPSAAEPAAKEG